jgi:CheY-like chemotaxis protein
MHDNRKFGPGQSVEQTGIYRVEHGRRHRPAHESVIFAGEEFPPCRRCGDQVTFQLVTAIEESPFWTLSQGAPSVLVACRNRSQADVVQDILHRDGYSVSVADSSEQAHRSILNNRYDVVITATDLDDDSAALDLASHAKRRHPSPVVVMIADAPTAETLRAMLKIPVDYCILAPFTPEEIGTAVSRQLAFREATAPIFG